jgi:hypothetical protein
MNTEPDFALAIETLRAEMRSEMQAQLRVLLEQVQNIMTQTRDVSRPGGLSPMQSAQDALAELDRAKRNL